MVRRGAGSAALVEPAIMEPPVAAELGAARVTRQASLNQLPRRLAMLGEIPVCHLVRDALVAQGVDQPVEQGRRIVAANGGSKTAVLAPNVVDEGSRAGEAADSVDDADRML